MREPRAYDGVYTEAVGWVEASKFACVMEYLFVAEAEVFVNWPLLKRGYEGAKLDTLLDEGLCELRALIGSRTVVPPYGGTDDRRPLSRILSQGILKRKLLKNIWDANIMSIGHLPAEKGG